jgi:hypothetical protein
MKYKIDEKIRINRSMIVVKETKSKSLFKWFFRNTNKIFMFFGNFVKIKIIVPYVIETADNPDHNPIIPPQL